MSINLSKIKEYIAEVIEDELEEASVTGALDGGEGPPKTPYAFRGKKKKDKDKEDEISTNSTGYEKVNENSAEKEKIFKYLVKKGDNPTDARYELNRSYDFVKKAYKKASVATKARIISDLSKYESVNEDVWTPAETKAVDKIEGEFQKLMAKKGIEPYSVEASRLWRSAGFNKKMRKIFGKDESVNEAQEISIKDAFKDLSKKHGSKKALDILTSVLAPMGFEDSSNKIKFQKKLLKKMTTESINESQKKKYDIAWDRFYKAYEQFNREVVILTKSAVDIEEDRTDQKIIYTAFKKYVNKFYEFMNGWYNQKQKNPYLDESINEGKYHDYRNDESMTPKQKIGHSMREVKNSLSELSKLIDMNVRLKKEMNVNSGSYWKNTHKALHKISERLVKLANKVGKLQ